MTELKPCPFCGKKVLVILKEPTYWEGRINGYQYQVVCDVHEDGCGASGGYYDTIKEAKEAWNRRHTIIIEELKRMFKEDKYFFYNQELEYDTFEKILADASEYERLMREGKIDENISK